MKTFIYGKLEATTDSCLLASDHEIALNVNLLKSFDGTLEHKTVSVVPTMGSPKTTPDIFMLIVGNMTSPDAIKKRAFEI